MKIKICGITREEEIRMLNDAGVDYAGFVFYKKSRRNISIEEAVRLKEMLIPSIKSVAVTVSPDVKLVEMIEAAGFDLIQIHGNLDEEILRKTRHPVWRAMNISDASVMKEYAGLPDGIEAVVVDAPDPGSGETFDWKDGESIRISGKKLVLAGGLNAENVRRGIKIFSPDVVDVSSSVEGKQGKDKDRINEFVNAVRLEDEGAGDE